MPPFAQYYQRAKNVIHAIQALAIFIAWAITIAILTKGGKLDGRIWYYFALVSRFKERSPSIREADPSAVLVLHTCSHLSNRHPRFPTDTPLCQCLCIRCYRYHIHHLLARRLCLPGRVGRTRISSGKRLEEQGQFV